MFEIPSNNSNPLSTTTSFHSGRYRDTAVFIKLHAIKPNIRNDSSAIRNLKREEVVFTRLRIGHTRITSSYLLNHEEQPFCIVCNQPFTVKHILIDSINFLQTQNKYYRANNLPQLFQDVPVNNILSFLKEINILNKI